MNIFPSPGKEHEKAVVSECDKPLHVCCRHPNYDPPGLTPGDNPNEPVVYILQRCWNDFFDGFLGNIFFDFLIFFQIE